ncbi:hypothetical protein EDEG_01428 [Edhazardia aedis USNM 41457]|uniref:General transcription factor TFIIB n=1 Tax=Edhazardia aedis (strain USNM 41457) TaxID=1003232 RepID=J9D9W7_EDHAE|nr:hypothetical protein EDEG_01428 [Edhazardia aedis USNM 41457]|eukprot:EJW04304.1 hypothetical protein EDEG_01428 [Edhazardia aedis USNM 41457]
MVKLRTVKLECPNCGEDKNIIEDYKNGYNVCAECGCTIGPRIIDEGSEWRNFGDSQTGGDPSRVGGPNNPFLETDVLDTIISGKDSLARTQMKSTMRGPERALINGFNLLTNYCDRNGIAMVIQDRAKTILKTVIEKKLAKGKNAEAVAAACLHLACKHAKCPRTFKEISLMCQVPKDEVGKCYKLIEKHFDKVEILNVEDIIERFCSDLSLGIKEQKTALRISQRLKKHGISAGKSPASVAAAVIYMVAHLYSKDKKINKDIHYVTCVSEVTIKNTYKDLLQYKYILITEDEFPKDIIDTLPNA